LLARLESEMKTTPEEVRPPLNSIIHEIHNMHANKANVRWKSHDGCRRAKQTWLEYNKKRTEKLLSKSRKDIARITATLTGHWRIGTHARKTNLPFNQHCRSCNDPQEAETPEHLLCHCPALGRSRHRWLGAHELASLNDVGYIAIDKIPNFLSHSKWI